MENSVCSFDILNNPSQRYANTVNLVFFKAVPLSKNFQKYVEGLKGWKKYIKLFPHSQLQIFVDEHVSEDAELMNIMKTLDARIYKFECPEYLRNSNFHVGLFPTMVRFYPMFDINHKAMRVAHIQELEPDIDSLKRIQQLEKVSRMKLPIDLSMIYSTNKLFLEELIDVMPKFEGVIPYGWILAGRFTAMEKIPFSLFTTYLKDVSSGKKYYNIYESMFGVKTVPEHEQYRFGVDESFLNYVYLPWLIRNNKAIGVIVEYSPASPIYYERRRIVRDGRSRELLNYILQKKQSISDSVKEFDNLFYTNKTNNNPRLTDVGNRFYEVVEKYPNWLGVGFTKLIMTVFKGYVYRNCLVIIQGGKIVGMKDVQ